MRQVAQGIALGLAALVSDFFIASGKGNRLETEEADDPGIVERELDNAAYLLIINAVDDGGDRNDVHTGVVQIVDGLQLYVEQIANLAVRIGGVADAVKLEISKAQAGFSSLAAELRRLGKLNSIGGRL